MGYSSIIRKTCKCGCGQLPSLGFEGYFYQHITDEVRERLDKKKERKTAAKNATSKLARVVANEDGNREMVLKHKGKSELLKLADKVFGDRIKSRDTVTVFDEEQEINVQAVKCPCCGKYCNIEAKDGDGKSLLNVLHFVDRGVYALRFDEDNAFAGDGYCNLKMHLNPKGKEYQNFKLFLIEKFGEPAVAEMELAKRKINRIEESQLRTVIEHYSTVKQ